MSNTTADSLELLGLSPALSKILRYFMLRPDARIHQRGLQKTLSLGSASVQRELERLQQLGILQQEPEGRRTIYSVVQRSPELRALERLEATSRDPSPLMREALADVAGLSVAFVFGSVASGADRPGSDIDLFVVELEDFDRRAFYSRLSEVQMLLGREIHAVRYRPDDLAQRLHDQARPAHAFVRDVLGGPKVFLVGSEEQLDSLTPTSEPDPTAGTTGAQGGGR